MNKLFCGFLLIISFTMPVYGRLGEKEADIEARFGKGTEGKKFTNHDRLKEVYYKFDGIDITVDYLDGKSASEEYSRYLSALTDKEIAAFLDANAAQFPAVDGTKPSWSLDGNIKKDEQGVELPHQAKAWALGAASKVIAKASLQYPYHQLTVSTVEYEDYLFGEHKDSSLKGF